MMLSQEFSESDLGSSIVAHVRHLLFDMRQNCLDLVYQFLGFLISLLMCLINNSLDFRKRDNIKLDILILLVEPLQGISTRHISK